MEQHFYHLFMIIKGLAVIKWINCKRHEHPHPQKTKKKEDELRQEDDRNQVP